MPDCRPRLLRRPALGLPQRTRARVLVGAKGLKEIQVPETEVTETFEHIKADNILPARVLVADKAVTLIDDL